MISIARYVIAIVLVVVVSLAGATLFIVSGVYNIGADEPHWPLTHRTIEALRDRSIDARAKALAVPPLDDPALVLKGAGEYVAMCTGCHLAPGMDDSEMRQGLYPQPPDLSKMRVAPETAFWVIKHGIKMTAMPAWGQTHDDATIWSMVAFLKKLPDLSPEAYRDLAAEASADDGHDDHHHGHHHGAADTHGSDEHSDESPNGHHEHD